MIFHRILHLIVVMSMASGWVYSSQHPGNEHNSLLWKVSGNDLKEPSYIFGTLHLICEDDFIEWEQLEEKMKQTHLLVLELNMEDPMVMLTLFQHMAMTGDTILPQLISEDDYREVESFFSDSLGTELRTQHHIKPFFLMSMVMPRMLSCLTTSYDMYLHEKSKQLDIPVHGLETIDEQIAVFRLLPYRQQAAMLVDAIRDYEKGKEDFMEMIGYYLEMDLERLLDHSSKMETEHEAFNYALLEERNLRWIPRMEELMKNGPVFFGVGAAHLPGKTGIISLLRRQGYLLQAVETAPR